MPQTKARSPHHNVYVVELDPAVLERPAFRDANPHYREGGRCFYVGMTGLDPDESFRNHQRGHRASRWVKRYGRWLRRRLYRRYNPMRYQQAVEMEVVLAERLRREGHAVWQN